MPHYTEDRTDELDGVRQARTQSLHSLPLLTRLLFFFTSAYLVTNTDAVS